MSFIGYYGVYDQTTGVFIPNPNGFLNVEYRDQITNGNEYNSVQIWGGLPSPVTEQEQTLGDQPVMCCKVPEKPIESTVPEPSVALGVMFALITVLIYRRFVDGA